MKVAFGDLRRQSEAIRADLERAFEDVLAGGRYIGGNYVQAFEEAFASWCGAREAVGVGSGTDAIELALRALDIGPGDEVITAANTCVPTVAGIEATGATPVLVDVDEDCFTLDPAALPGALTTRTRAIVPVHLYGQCAEMDAVCAFAREHGLVVVEDAAQGHGAEHGGRRAGTLADVAAFSFYPTKNLGALGDAGAVLTDDPEVAARVRAMRSFGERAMGPPTERGQNSRLDALQAAMLGVKLKRLEDWNERRRELAALYDELLEDVPLRRPSEAPGRRHVYHLYVVRASDRDRLQGELAEREVETLVHYPLAVHENPPYRSLDRPGQLERSERACREVLSLPLYPELTDEEARAVAAALQETLGT